MSTYRKWMFLSGRIIVMALAVTAIAFFDAEGAKKLPLQSSEIRTSSGSYPVQQPAVIDVKQENVSQTFGDTITDGQIDWQVLSGGGLLNGYSADYFHSGTINQTAIGSGLSGNLAVKHGFWQTPPNSTNGCCDTPGDANNDGQANVGDAVFIVSYVFKGGAPPDCILQSDANGDCDINVADAVFMVMYCFKDGHTPSCGCSR